MITRFPVYVSSAGNQTSAGDTSPSSINTNDWLPTLSFSVNNDLPSEGNYDILGLKPSSLNETEKLTGPPTVNISMEYLFPTGLSSPYSLTNGAMSIMAGLNANYNSICHIRAGTTDFSGCYLDSLNISWKPYEPVLCRANFTCINPPETGDNLFNDDTSLPTNYEPIQVAMGQDLTGCCKINDTPIGIENCNYTYNATWRDVLRLGENKIYERRFVNATEQVSVTTTGLGVWYDNSFAAAGNVTLTQDDVLTLDSVLTMGGHISNQNFNIKQGEHGVATLSYVSYL